MSVHGDSDVLTTGLTRTAAHRSPYTRSSLQFPMVVRSDWFAADQANQQKDERDNEEDVQPSAKCCRRDHPEQPQHDEQYDEEHQHGRAPAPVLAKRVPGRGRMAIGLLRTATEDSCLRLDNPSARPKHRRRG